MALLDHYLFFSLSFFLMIASTGLYLTRSRWRPQIPSHFPFSSTFSSFASDLESGLSSDTFSLSANLLDGDARGGLDTAAKQDVLRIMKSKRVGFDEARRLHFEAKLAKNGIGADGRPMDPRAVMFS